MQQAGTLRNFRHETMSKNKKRNKQQKPFLYAHRFDWLEIIATVLSLWFIVFPRPFYPLLIVLICLPIVGLVLNGLSKPSIASLVTISTDSKYKYDVADFIDMPAIAIVFRVVYDYEYEDFFSLLIPGTLALVITITVLLRTHSLKILPHDKNKRTTVLLVYASLFVYSYGATYAINCAFDFSDVKNYRVAVVDKRMTTSHSRRGGVRHSYYFRISPWGHHYDTEEISVTLKQFDGIAIGDSVNIGLHKGLFNIPWYRLE